MAYFSDTRGKSGKHAIFLRSFVPPEKVHGRLTSDSDVCKVDLDMQMSFLNAALYNVAKKKKKHFNVVSHFNPICKEREREWAGGWGVGERLNLDI